MHLSSQNTQYNTQTSFITPNTLQHHLIITQRIHMTDIHISTESQLLYRINIGVELPTTPSLHESWDFGHDIQCLGNRSL